MRPLWKSAPQNRDGPRVHRWHRQAGRIHRGPVDAVAADEPAEPELLVHEELDVVRDFGRTLDREDLVAKGILFCLNYRQPGNSGVPRGSRKLSRNIKMSFQHHLVMMKT